MTTPSSAAIKAAEVRMRACVRSEFRGRSENHDDLIQDALIAWAKRPTVAPEEIVRRIALSALRKQKRRDQLNATMEIVASDERTPDRQAAAKEKLRAIRAAVRRPLRTTTIKVRGEVKAVSTEAADLERELAALAGRWLAASRLRRDDRRAAAIADVLIALAHGKLDIERLGAKLRREVLEPQKLGGWSRARERDELLRVVASGDAVEVVHRLSALGSIAPKDLIPAPRTAERRAMVEKVQTALDVTRETETSIEVARRVLRVVGLSRGAIGALDADLRKAKSRRRRV